MPTEKKGATISCLKSSANALFPVIMSGALIVVDAWRTNDPMSEEFCKRIVPCCVLNLKVVDAMEKKSWLRSDVSRVLQTRCSLSFEWCSFFFNLMNKSALPTSEGFCK